MLTRMLLCSVQFYDDPDCSLLRPGFNSSLDYWLNLQGPNSDVLIVLGVPGDSRDQDVTDAMYFVPPDQVRPSRLMRMDGMHSRSNLRRLS